MRKFFKILSRSLLVLILLVTLLAGGVFWVAFVGFSNPGNRKTVAGIRPPHGFERVELTPGSFGEYCRNFPLQKRGARMRYADGHVAFGQFVGYAVLDLPLISDQEYCCDAVQRMRSEYLFSRGRYADIHFDTFSKGTMRYGGGADHDALHKYLRRVYDATNTSTLRHELRKKKISDIRPGDVLVYAAGGRHEFGHAVLVMDAAVNPKTGEKAILVAQSSMPALTMHIVRNVFHPRHTAWTVVREGAAGITISHIRFSADDLRTWGE